jgi:hypothetical protein
MADIDLPVFSFRPNWTEAMSERLSFMTDVMQAAKGAEQRRSLRETPRRSCDLDFLLVGPERTFWDLFMNRIGGEEVMAPIYWEGVGVSVGLIAGITDRIDFDTTYSEWPYFDGGLALVAGVDALTYEVVQIAGVDSGGIDLVDPVVSAWPAGTKLYPLRRAVVEDFGELTHPSAAVGKVTARLRWTTANPWTPAASAAPTYGGVPVLIDEPNWVDDLKVTMERVIATLDTQIGLTYQKDTLGRFLSSQSHRYFLSGRARMAALRDLLYRYRGRAGTFWLPTFRADFKLVSSVSSGATQLTVENTGFGYTGGPSSGREYIMIRHSTGVIFRKLLDVIPGTTPATEKLVLDAAVGLALSPGLVRKISFMDYARFDADEFEIMHHAGLDGLHECSTVFRNFKNTRTSPTPISYPIPAASMNNLPCGIELGPPTALNKAATAFGANTGGLVVNMSASQYLILTKPRAAVSGGALLYDAWSAWNNDNGIGASNSPVFGQSWDNGFYVYGNNGGAETLVYNPRDEGLSANLYATADDAYNALALVIPVALTGYTQYRITNFVDNNPGDNRGGISLIAQVGT